MQTAPPFDHSVEMIEAIRAAAIRLTREKMVSVNRQAKALSEYAHQRHLAGEAIGAREISQQIWSNFTRRDSSHLPNNRAILDLAWAWLHAEHRVTITEEIQLRRREVPLAVPSGHPSHANIGFLADVMVGYATPHFCGDLAGSHTLLLPNASVEFDYIPLWIHSPELDSRVSFSLQRRTHAGQMVEHGYDGAIVPHVYGLMVVASGPRGRDPATIMLRDAHVREAPPGYAYCGTLSVVQNEDQCVTQPCIFLPYVESQNLDREEMKDELRRMLSVPELMANVLGMGSLTI